MVQSIGVLGGNGFIGSNLVRDLKGVSITKDYLPNQTFDILVNANGNSKKYLPETDPLADFDLSVRNTLKSLIDFKFKLYIYISSCEVANVEDKNVDVRELSRYALSKFLSECLVRKYCDKWIILRLNGPIGPGMKKGPIYDIMNRKKLWISAESKFQLIHTSYIAKVISELKCCNEIINVTGRDSVCLKEVMSLCGEVEYPEYPVIVHNVSVDKLNSIMPVPSSLESLRLC